LVFSRYFHRIITPDNALMCTACFLCSQFSRCYCMFAGSILEGPDPDTLKPIVQQAMPLLISLMTDASPVVRNTVAWTIGRVCELLPEAAVDLSYLVPLVEGLVRGLEDVPRVAANVCWVMNAKMPWRFRTR